VLGAVDGGRAPVSAVLVGGRALALGGLLARGRVPAVGVVVGGAYVGVSPLTRREVVGRGGGGRGAPGSATTEADLGTRESECDVAAWPRGVLSN
jgi:hypothetical protein